MNAKRLRICKGARIGALIVPLLAASGANAWDLPGDKGTIPEAQVEEILAGKDFPEVSVFSKKLDYVDFTVNGMPFTQVVIRLDPDKPLMRNGKKVVLVA